MFLPLTNPLLPPPDSSKYYEYIVVVKRILNIVLELDPPFSVDESHDPKTIVALTKALDRFKSIYSAKYKQNVADYGYSNQETFVALGRELREKNEAEFNKLIKDLNNSQWTLLLTGKIHEIRAIGQKIDLALAELFTKEAIVHGAGSYPNPKTGITKEGLGLATNHHYLKDGQLHTIHIYGDSTGNMRTGVYIPKEFSFTQYIGGRMGSATFTNGTTKQIIRASHVLVIPNLQLDDQNRIKQLTEQDKNQIASQIKKNMQTAANAKGSRYIGETGGPGGHTEPDIHSHLTIFKNEQSMGVALTNKYAVGEIGDFADNSKILIGDFRSLITLS